MPTNFPHAAPEPAAPRERPGLYLHVPFCSAVCPYCDFAVTVGGEGSRRRYAAALGLEIERVAAETAGEADSPFSRGAFDTVYLGGGTPSALTPAELAAILDTLTAAFDVRPAADGAAGAGTARLFLEVNPEDATAASLAAWRRLGFATVSLGVQSFDAAALGFLGRRHDPARARASVELARAAGFPTVSLDLIYGLPGQTAADWRRDLETAVALAPDHLSCYQLTVEPGTPFGTRRRRGELVELPEDEQAELFHTTHRFLADAGWPAYEVSNFARAPEHRSLHNRKYWRHAPYLGLGPSAHSFDGRRRRWWNERRLGPWCGRLDRSERPLAGDETLDDRALALERLMLGLRTVEGIDLAGFRAAYGIDLETRCAGTLERLTAAGLLQPAAGRLRPTLDGLAVADGLAAQFDLGPSAADRPAARSVGAD